MGKKEGEKKDKAGFGAFLEKTRLELNLSTEELSKAMAKDIPEYGIVFKERRKRLNKENAAGYSHYEKMVTVPKLETIIRLAKAFSVPVDYLLNYKDYGFLDAKMIRNDPLGLPPEKYAEFHFGKKLRGIRESKKLSMKDFEDKFGMPKPSLQQYERYKGTPGEKVLRKFVTYLTVNDASVFYPEIESIKKKLNLPEKNKTSGGYAGISMEDRSQGDIIIKNEKSVMTITLPEGMDQEKAIEEVIRQLKNRKKVISYRNSQNSTD